MKTKLIVFVLSLFVFSFIYSRVFAATPDPIIEYQLGAELQGVYLPKAYSNCWVTSMGNQNYYIGPFIPDSNTHLTVVRFLSKQSPVGMGRYAKCEAPTNVSAEERAEWIMARDSSINRSKVRIYYVDGTWDQVTLTVTPSHSPTYTNSPTSTSTLTPSQTPTPKAAPWPTKIFYTGDSVDTIQYYAPKKNELCLTWNPYTGFIGPYSIPSGKNFLIVKFTENQTSQSMRIVWCEDASNHTPEERLSFTIQDQPCCYFWDRSVIKYIGSNMTEVTLTSTPTVTQTPNVTVTYSPTHTETATRTSTETDTATITATVTATSTKTKTSTPTVTNTRTVTNSVTRTRTSTSTVTPVLAPDKIVPSNVSTLHIAKAGHICYGQVIGGTKNVIVEFVAGYSTGIEIIGGGCFTQKYYSLSQVMRYLERNGIRYSYVSLPRPALSPSRTIQPTVTIVRYLAISMRTEGSIDFLVTEPGTVCWGAKVGSEEYKVVRFQKSMTSTVRITSGGCNVGQSLSAEDVFNYLRRVKNTPLNGFMEIR